MKMPFFSRCVRLAWHVSLVTGLPCPWTWWGVRRSILRPTNREQSWWYCYSMDRNCHIQTLQANRGKWKRFIILLPFSQIPILWGKMSNRTTYRFTHKNFK